CALAATRTRLTASRESACVAGFLPLQSEPNRGRGRSRDSGHRLWGWAEPVSALQTKGRRLSACHAGGLLSARGGRRGHLPIFNCRVTMALRGSGCWPADGLDRGAYRVEHGEAGVRRIDE